MKRNKISKTLEFVIEYDGKEVPITDIEIVETERSKKIKFIYHDEWSETYKRLKKHDNIKKGLEYVDNHIKQAIISIILKDKE